MYATTYVTRTVHGIPFVVPELVHVDSMDGMFRVWAYNPATDRRWGFCVPPDRIDLLAYVQALARRAAWHVYPDLFPSPNPSVN